MRRKPNFLDDDCFPDWDSDFSDLAESLDFDIDALAESLDFDVSALNDFD